MKTAIEKLEEQFGRLGSWSDCPAGWYSEVKSALEALNSVDGWKSSYITQLKEKFGGLRIYYNYPPDGEKMFDVDKVDNIIGDASLKCQKICVDCGAGVSSTDKGRYWFMPFCESCKGEMK